MSSPLVSILMPVKNAAPYLETCLNSILDQTILDWELIAINDHSSDISYDILMHYAKTDQRINVFQNDGSGIISALRKAYKESNGNLITRMDADDKMAPEKLEKMKTHLVEKGQGHLVTGLVKYFSIDALGDGYKKYQNWLNELSHSENNYSEIYKECVIPSPCWMIFREDLDKCGAFLSSTYPEDYDLCFRFYKNGLKVSAIKEVLHHWRDYPERTSRNDPKYSDVHFFDLKMNYFLEIDFDKSRPLVLWGTGKKGKQLAKALHKKGINFYWITDNSKKIGHDIYSTKVQHSNILKTLPGPQVIIAVAAPSSLLEIHTTLKKLHLKKGENYFQFC